MTTPLPELERRALELVKQTDFGDEAARVNAAIVEQVPQDVSAWTRLGRCHLEQRNWDEAVTALRRVLSLNPSHTIATNLLNEVRKRRSTTPAPAQGSTTGFGAREFTTLGTLADAPSRMALTTRIGALLDTLNATHTASLIAQARRDAGAYESTLFDPDVRNTAAAGRLVVYHRGGRFEPQIDLGWFSHPPFPASCVRIGIGFDFSQTEDGGAAAQHERALAFFERFQQTLERSWKNQLTQWMADNGGFIQHADAPATDLLPAQAVEWLVNCRNAAQLPQVFVGRWLFLDNIDHARILGDKAKLAKTADDTFRALYPLWLGAYRGSTA